MSELRICFNQLEGNLGRNLTKFRESCGISDRNCGQSWQVSVLVWVFFVNQHRDFEVLPRIWGWSSILVKTF